MNPWFVGSNGYWFLDLGGHRYCVARMGEDSYEVARDGVVINENIPSVGAAKMIAQNDGRIHERFA